MTAQQPAGNGKVLKLDQWGRIANKRQPHRTMGLLFCLFMGNCKEAIILKSSTFLHIPHASTLIPEEERRTFTADMDLELRKMKDIQKQEGDSPDWYGNMLFLGELFGLPVFTLTSARPQKENPPAKDYLELIRTALFNGYIEWFPLEADEYLEECLKPLRYQASNDSVI